MCYKVETQGRSWKERHKWETKSVAESKQNSWGRHSLIMVKGVPTLRLLSRAVQQLKMQ